MSGNLCCYHPTPPYINQKVQLICLSKLEHLRQARVTAKRVRFLCYHLLFNIFGSPESAGISKTAFYQVWILHATHTVRGGGGNISASTHHPPATAATSNPVPHQSLHSLPSPTTVLSSSDDSSRKISQDYKQAFSQAWTTVYSLKNSGAYTLLEWNLY